MNDFRKATLEALDEIGHDAVVARARKRVAARREAGQVEPAVLRAWVPVVAAVAFTASALGAWVALGTNDPNKPEVLAVPEPEEEPEEFPPDDVARPGMAPKPPLPEAERMPIPEAPSFDDDGEATVKMGTLVAIAIGGRCAFSVDGEPKGTTSSIRVEATVGEHVVGCTPPGGATREQTVRVKAGKPGIASFRIHESEGDRSPPRPPSHEIFGDR